MSKKILIGTVTILVALLAACSEKLNSRDEMASEPISTDLPVCLEVPINWQKLVFEEAGLIELTGVRTFAIEIEGKVEIYTDSWGEYRHYPPNGGYNHLVGMTHDGTAEIAGWVVTSLFSEGGRIIPVNDYAKTVSWFGTELPGPSKIYPDSAQPIAHCFQ